MESGNHRMRTYGMFLAGGMIGAGIALLLAPQSGKRTRRDIRHLGEKVVKKSEVIGMELRHSLDRLADNVSEKWHDGLELSRDLSKKTGREVRRAMQSGKAFLQDGAQRIHVS